VALNGWPILKSQGKVPNLSILNELVLKVSKDSLEKIKLKAQYNKLKLDKALKVLDLNSRKILGEAIALWRNKGLKKKYETGRVTTKGVVLGRFCERIRLNNEMAGLQ
jgi:hypothetical protein